MFDFGLSHLTSSVFYFQKILIGAAALGVMFTLLRLALWALLSVQFPRMAGPLSSLITYAFAAIILADPSTRWAALDFGYRAACGVLGGAPNLGGLPGTGGLVDGIMRELDGVLGEVQRLMF